MTELEGGISPPLADRRHATVVRDLLRRSLHTEGIQDVLGVSGDVLARPLDRAVHLRRLQGTGALETLIRLFLLDEPVATSVAGDALGGPDLDALEALGMVAQVGDEARGAVRLVPHGEIVIASDLPDRDGVHPDHVAGLHRPSMTLADLTARRRVRTALDVGTGCGIQALLAAHHAERVVATDINGRALAFAELNAALNGIDNIEFRQGSFFEPVAGETFELVVLQPAVRDLAGDGVCLPRQRTRARPRQRAPRGRAARPARRRRVRDDHGQLDPGRRRSGETAARVARRPRL